MFRQKISEIIGYYIPENQWDAVFRKADAHGLFTLKTAFAILWEICKKLDELEASKNEKPTADAKPESSKPAA